MASRERLTCNLFASWLPRQLSATEWPRRLFARHCSSANEWKWGDEDPRKLPTFKLPFIVMQSENTGKGSTFFASVIRAPCRMDSHSMSGGAVSRRFHAVESSTSTRFYASSVNILCLFPLLLFSNKMHDGSRKIRFLCETTLRTLLYCRIIRLVVVIFFFFFFFFFFFMDISTAFRFFRKILTNSRWFYDGSRQTIVRSSSMNSVVCRWKYASP